VRVVTQNPELHLAVTHNVGVRRNAAPVAVDQVFDDAVVIVADKVADGEGDAELFANGARIDDVLLPRAMRLDFFLVNPVLHVSARNVVARFFKEQGGNGAINAPGHGYEDF